MNESGDDPMTPTDQLRREHTLILEALVVAGTMAAFLRLGRRVAREDVLDFVAFIRDFADGFHHAGEEQVLFPWMEARGGGAVAMPLGCMRAEHEVGREMLASIQQATDGLPGTAAALADLLTLFVGHLGAHIRKEDMVLFPLASGLGEDEPNLVEDFRKVRADAAEIERLHRRLVERLAGRYPPAR